MLFASYRVLITSMWNSRGRIKTSISRGQCETANCHPFMCNNSTALEETRPCADISVFAGFYVEPSTRKNIFPKQVY